MDGLFQVLAGVMLSVVLGIFLNKQNKDLGIVLTIAVCCMVIAASMVYLRPVVDFITQLRNLGQMDSQTVEIMLKVVGIGLVAEIGTLICNDSGNAALGKTVQMLATVVILWLSLPLMNALLELVQEILGEV